MRLMRRSYHSATRHDDTEILPVLRLILTHPLTCTVKLKTHEAHCKPSFCNGGASQAILALSGHCPGLGYGTRRTHARSFERHKGTCQSDRESLLQEHEIHSNAGALFFANGNTKCQRAGEYQVSTRSITYAEPDTHRDPSRVTHKSQEARNLWQHSRNLSFFHCVDLKLPRALPPGPQHPAEVAEQSSPGGRVGTKQLQGPCKNRGNPLSGEQ